MRRSRVLLAALALVVYLPCPSLRAGQDPVVRIGAWNIQWLGRPDRRGGQLQDPEDIARYLVASKVDVLALSEVTQDSVTGVYRTSTLLSRALKKVSEQTGQEWRHLLVANEDPADRDQLCGIAWNASRLKLAGQPFRIPVRKAGPSADTWTRHPHAIKLSAGEGLTDLVLIPVHMKSNHGGAEPAARRRAEEARTLVRSLGQVQNHFLDDDVVILGDFNMLSNTEVAHARYAHNGFRDLNAGDQPTWIRDARYEPAPFDRILVPEEQPETTQCQLRVFREHHLGSEEAFRARLSDHYMVITELRVMTDDD